jgi:apolipoprotein N-acyltransferase
LGLFDRFRWLIALLAGAVSAFAFEPVGVSLLMPIAFALLCELLARTNSLKGALFIGWLFGLGQFVVGLNWIATAFTYQAAMPAWLGWVAVVLLSLYLAVYPALATGLAWRLGRDRPLALVLALAGGWALTEWLRAGMFTGFAWNPVAASAVEKVDDLVPLIGTYGASAFIVLGAGALWMLSKWEIRPLLVWVAFGAVTSLYVDVTVEEQASGMRRPIRIVQPNIGQDDKWRPGFAEISAKRLAQLSAQPGGTGPRLLFWPEAAVTNPLEDERPEPYSDYAAFERRRAAASIGGQEYLLTGGIGLFSPDGRQITGAANSVYVLAPGGRMVARYDKAHLVPYGEYLPMRPLLSAIGLSRLAPGNIDFIPGPGPRTVALPGWGKVGFQLCYEIIFSGEVIDRGNRPDVLFNPSNDAWFGAWGPPQHLAQARLRAAEEGIPVIRSTPTGISAVIDARGRLLNSLPWLSAGVIDARLPSAAEPTLFARFGNLIPLLLGLALVIAAIALGAAGRYRRET